MCNDSAAGGTRETADERCGETFSNRNRPSTSSGKGIHEYHIPRRASAAHVYSLLWESSLGTTEMNASSICDTEI